MTPKSALKVSTKKLAYGKVPQKFQNSRVRPGLEKTQIKAAFFLGVSLIHVTSVT